MLHWKRTVVSKMRVLGFSSGNQLQHRRKNTYRMNKANGIKVSEDSSVDLIGNRCDNDVRFARWIAISKNNLGNQAI